jgi:hypothetical protein
LDIFLLSKALLEKGFLIHSLVSERGFSDHWSITLKLKSGSNSTLPPFKFNPIWMEEDDLQGLVRNNWHWLCQENHLPLMQQFAKNLDKF